MPYTVRKSSSKAGGYNIVNKNTGKKAGHSATKSGAQKSANARNAAHHGWKATGKK